MPLLPLALLVMFLGTDAALAQVSAPAVVVGTVTYRRGIALPPEAIVEVRLQDTSRADAAARRCSRTVPAMMRRSRCT